MRLRRWMPAALLGLLALPPAWADQEFDKLHGEFEEAQQKYYADLQEKYAKGDAPAFDMTADPPPLRDFRPKFKALAEKNAGKSEAIEPLVWLVRYGNSGPRGMMAAPNPDGEGSVALRTLTEKHAGDPAIVPSLESMRMAVHSIDADAVMAFYQRVEKENKEPEAKAWAQFSVGAMLYEPFMFAMPEGALMPGGKKLDPKDKDRAIAMFRDVLREYPKTEAGSRAEPYIFELEKLQIGMTAPDFEGKDLAGKTIKLSDFRGKVVVLDFWGFW